LKNRIRVIRKEKKMTQQELAKRCEVSRQTINMVENDKYDPTLKLAMKLALNLETTVEELFSF